MKYDKVKYKVYDWKNWMVLHWILNPGLAFNELILGQRMPKVTLEDKTIDKPRFERSFVPCPHCETLHDGRTWSIENGTAFKNWFGLYCKNCGNIIPCLINGLSFLTLLITFPIWGWFRSYLKAKWLEKQPKRYENINIEQVPNLFGKKNWIKSGLSWGLCMFVLMSVFNIQTISFGTLLVEFIIWMVAGLSFGYMMKVFFNQAIHKKNKNTTS
ncbi:hypothetical protein [Aureispira sp. CCB-QB1]|uniref:hypothetical protein n=1 Tax=Aureispira sp. CCB-QB1 TaxID=1313421 RepID=UPI000695DA5D|nr:hypothetical protein [Aureispira sp. CCB-QB1]